MSWGKGRVSEVIFESTEETVAFLLINDGALKAEQIEKLADADPSVMMVRFNGLKGKRQWVDVSSKVVKRVLLHPSRERTNAVVLRIRFFDKRVDDSLLAAVRVAIEDAGVRIEIPTTKTKDMTKASGAPQTKALDIKELDRQMREMNKQKNAPTTQQPPAASAASTSPKAPTTLSAEKVKQAIEAPKAAVKSKTVSTATPPAEAGSGDSPNPLPIEPESTTPSETTPTKTEKTAADASTPEPLAGSSVTKSEPGLVFMPGVRTRDVVAGFTDMTLRLEKGLKTKPGIRRIAVFPFLALDPKAQGSKLAPISRALLADRLVRRSGIISANKQRLEATIKSLPTDQMGRFAIDEARAVGDVVGADTLVIGTVSTTGNGYLVDARAVDVTTGARLVDASQEFESESMMKYADLIRVDKTVGGGIWRSAVLPGWGQFYQGDYGRGVTYGAIFATSFISGVIAGVLGSVYTDQYTSSNRENVVNYREQANRAYGQANVFLAISGLMWASSIADAWITGKNHSSIDPKRYEEALEFSK